MSLNKREMASTDGQASDEVIDLDETSESESSGDEQCLDETTENICAAIADIADLDGGRARCSPRVATQRAVRTPNKSSSTSKKNKSRSKKRLVCKQCEPNRYFAKQKVLDKHTQLLHETLSEVLCEWCAKRFFSETQKLIHQRLYSHDKTF